MLGNGIKEEEGYGRMEGGGGGAMSACRQAERTGSAALSLNVVAPSLTVAKSLNVTMS